LRYVICIYVVGQRKTRSKKVNTKRHISGVSYPHGEFYIESVERRPVPSVVRDLLANRAVGLHIKGYLDPAEARTIKDNFDLSDALQNRLDDVFAVKIGADQYAKASDEYVAEVEESSAQVAKLFHNARHIGEKARRDIQACLPQGVGLRRAEYMGHLAGDIRGVKWLGEGEFTLAPHEDFSQLSHPGQEGFEIQEVETPVAVNIYPFVAPCAGRFRAYNIQPDEESRTLLGVTHTGYPYPQESLECFEYIELQVESGDALLFNGRFVHGVRGSSCEGSKERLLLNFFVGAKKGGNCIISWT